MQGTCCWSKLRKELVGRRMREKAMLERYGNPGLPTVQPDHRLSLARNTTQAKTSGSPAATHTPFALLPVCLSVSSPLSLQHH